jgi:hypothetical protein
MDEWFDLAFVILERTDSVHFSFYETNYPPHTGSRHALPNLLH